MLQVKVVYAGQKNTKHDYQVYMAMLIWFGFIENRYTNNMQCMRLTQTLDFVSGAWMVFIDLSFFQVQVPYRKFEGSPTEEAFPAM